jgi:hypothetical protein
MNSIFISYRRQDAAGHAGRLFDRLVVRYGDAHVFMDHHDLPPGVDFATAIEANLLQASVVLAVMGPHWIDARDADGRPRLAQPEDFVRRELLSALAAGKRVIPVLVGGAQIPAEEQLPTELAALVRLQACELRDSRFDDDLKALLESLPGEKGTGTEKGTDLFSAAENKSVPFSVPFSLQGRWLAKVSYPWQAEVTERFELEQDGDDFYGTGTFLAAEHPLENIEVLDDGLKFSLRSEALMGDERRQVTHSYRVRQEGDTLQVRMQSSGGFNDGPPLRFTARRAP